MDAKECESLKLRLDNWGRWARENRTQGSSSLFTMMREAGYKPEYTERNERMAVDAADAERVEAAWRQMEDSPEKRLLQEVYGCPNRPLWISCRRSGIRFRNYEHYMLRSLEQISTILCGYDKIPITV